MNIDLKLELTTEFEQAKEAEESEQKQQAITKSATLRGCERSLVEYEKNRVDPAFIEIARPALKLAVGLAMDADRNVSPEEILADLYLAWADPSTAHDPSKGTQAAWTKSTFSNRQRQLKSNLCIPGKTAELNKAVGNGDATLMDTLAAAIVEEQPEPKILPALAFNPLSDMAIRDGLSCAEIANATGEHVRKVQRAIKNDVERAVKKRVQDMKFAGMSVEQIAQQIGGTLTAGSGEIAPAAFYQAPEFGGHQPNKKTGKSFPVRASKPQRSGISLAFISGVAPQASFDFGGAI